MRQIAGGEAVGMAIDAAGRDAVGAAAGAAGRDAVGMAAGVAGRDAVGVATGVAKQEAVGVAAGSTGRDAVGCAESPAAGWGTGPGSLREDLLDLLRQKDVRRRMNEALLREATGEAKSTGVIRAYELVQKILQDAGEDGPVEELDLRQYSDCQLRRMMERIRRTAAGGDTVSDGKTSTDGTTSTNKRAAPNREAAKETDGDTFVCHARTDDGGGHGQAGAA